MKAINNYLTMNLNFNIDYHTRFGEELVLNLIHTDQKGNQKASQFRMGTKDGLHWSYQMNMPDEQSGTIIDYYYSVDCSGTEKAHEWTTFPHRLELNARKAHNYHIYDHWTEMPEDSYLYSSAFTDCLNRRIISVPVASDMPKTIRLSVKAPQLRANHRLVITGADDVLGAWHVDKGMRMTEHVNNEWTVDINADSLSNAD